MLRLIGLAVILGAFAAASVYLAVHSARQDVPETAGEALASVADEWPICTTMQSLGGEAEGDPLDADFVLGKRALAAGRWSVAIAAFKLAAAREPANADIQNYLGYAYRSLRQREQALAHFRQAIMLNPRHRGAHQHLGEFYLAAGDPAGAAEHLAALDRICLIPCVEQEDLQRAIMVYRADATR